MLLEVPDDLANEVTAAGDEWYHLLRFAHPHSDSDVYAILEALAAVDTEADHAYGFRQPALALRIADEWAHDFDKAAAVAWILARQFDPSIALQLEAAGHTAADLMDGDAPLVREDETQPLGYLLYLGTVAPSDLPRPA